MIDAGKLGVMMLGVAMTVAACGGSDSESGGAAGGSSSGAGGSLAGSGSSGAGSGTAGAAGGTAGTGTAGSAGGSAGSATAGSGTAGSGATVTDWSCGENTAACQCTKSPGSTSTACSSSWTCCFKYTGGGLDFCNCSNSDAAKCMKLISDAKGEMTTGCPPP